MILIAHRGLFQGPDKEKENHPDQIALALEQGYHAEIDLYCIKRKLYLGHDEPTHPIDDDFLDSRKLWIHCKNIEALYYLSTHISYSTNYFWHENDQYTLTSKKYIWTYPGKELTDNSIMVMPEHTDKTLQNTKHVYCYGICSDYVELIKSWV